MPSDTGWEDLKCPQAAAGEERRASFDCESWSTNVEEDCAHLHESLSFPGVVCTSAETLCHGSLSVNLVATFRLSFSFVFRPSCIFFLSLRHTVDALFMLEKAQRISSWMKWTLTMNGPFAMTFQKPLIYDQPGFSNCFHWYFWDALCWAPWARHWRRIKGIDLTSLPVYIHTVSISELSAHLKIH